jgi:hypothetical protein
MSVWKRRWKQKSVVERPKNESKPGIFSETHFKRTNPGRGALWDAQYLQLWKHHGNIEPQRIESANDFTRSQIRYLRIKAKKAAIRIVSRQRKFNDLGMKSNAKRIRKGALIGNLRVEKKGKQHIWQPIQSP